MPASKDPWYRDGLKFTCTQCGDCCTGAPGYVWVNQEECETLAKAIGLPLAEFIERHTRLVGVRRSLNEKPNNDCVFFERTVGCTVYNHRPRQCRTWPFWESNLRTPASWQHTCEICPGSGHGRLYSIEEIERSKEVIRI